MRAAGTTLMTEEGLQATGLVAGAIGGFVVLRALKGGESNTVARQQVLDGTRSNIGVANHPARHHHESELAHLGEAGVIGGATLLGVVLGTVIARTRQPR